MSEGIAEAVSQLAAKAASAALRIDLELLRRDMTIRRRSTVWPNRKRGSVAGGDARERRARRCEALRVSGEVRGVEAVCRPSPSCRENRV